MKSYWERKERFRHYKHPIVEFFSIQRINEIKKYVDFKEVSYVLDIGGGNGVSSFYYESLFKVKIIAIDRYESMLKFNPVNSKALSDARYLPFKDNSFDLVNIWEVLHHIDNPATVIREAYRVSKKYLVLFEPNRNNPLQFLFSIYDKEHRKVLRYNKKYIKKIVEDSGFSIISYEKVGSLFPNLTPLFIFKIIKKIHFVNIFGISHMIVAKK